MNHRPKRLGVGLMVFLLVAPIPARGQKNSLVERLFESAGMPLDAAQLESEVGTEFRGFFPQAVVHFEPKQKALMVLTCTQGLGPKMMEKIRPEVEQTLRRNEKLYQAARWGDVGLLLGGLFGATPIVPDYMIVAFEEEATIWRRSDMAVWSVRTGVDWRYDQLCAAQESEPQIAQPSAAPSKQNDCHTFRNRERQALHYASRYFSSEMKENAALDSAKVLDLDNAKQVIDSMLTYDSYCRKLAE